MNFMRKAVAALNGKNIGQEVVVRICKLKSLLAAGHFLIVFVYISNCSCLSRHFHRVRCSFALRSQLGSSKPFRNENLICGLANDAEFVRLVFASHTRPVVLIIPRCTDTQLREGFAGRPDTVER